MTHPPITLVRDAEGPRSDDRPPRIALYSHDTEGLGHVRRNLLIARALSGRGRNPIILMLSGVHEAAAFSMPEGVDCLTLPSLGKDTRGGYFARTLGVPIEQLIDLRSDTLTAALDSFRPDVLVVDKLPLGAFDELRPALEMLRRRGRCRNVLGLREILDDPTVVRREWRLNDFDGAVRRYYDRVWVYGDRAVFDPTVEYDLPADIAARVRFSGYLAPSAAPASRDDDDPVAALGLPAGPLALGVVGGGRDGLPLAEAFIRAPRPAGMSAVLVTGPLMPVAERAALRRLAAGDAGARVLEFVTDPTPLLRRADRVVAMGGYNTVCELLGHRARALIVPRTRPRTEQLIRAERFARLGLLDMLHPEALTAGAIGAWLASTEPAPRPTVRVRLDGTSHLQRLLEDVMAAMPVSREAIHASA